MNQGLVTEALSKAIVEEAELSFAGLREGLGRNAVKERVENALEQLKDLRTGAMPDYGDPWVALFYVLWYQPSQINLVYSSLRPFGGGEHERWQVVDFGAGALAAQFSVALALAEGGQPATVVQSIEPNDAMFEIGNAIWNRFVDVLDDDNLRRACRNTTAERCSVGDIERRKGARRALLGIHPVYHENRDSVAADMRTLRKELKPHLGVVSTHRMNGQLARSVSPFKRVKETEVEPVFSGYLHEITALRRRIWTSLGQPTGIAQAYLRSQVSWEWRAATVLIYDR